MTIAIETESKALAHLDKARAFEITSFDDREAVESEVRLLKALEDEITATFGPHIKSAHEAHKALLAEQNAKLVPVNEARRLLKSKCIAWDTEQERIRREEEARLRAEALKRDEEERLAMAAQAEAEGDHEVADAILAMPTQIPQVTVPRQGPKPSTLTAGRSQWSCECFDPAAFVKAAASGNTLAMAALTNDAAREFIEKQMGGIVRSMKQTFNVPGCRAVERKV